MEANRKPRVQETSLYTDAYRRDRRRRVLGWLLVGVGSVMGVVHLLTHLGRWQIIGLQDLLLGYPMAAVLVLAGFMVVGSSAQSFR